MAALKVERVEYARYRLPLARPLMVGGKSIEDREGRLVRFTSDAGIMSYGEISPLPGLHRESIGDAEQVLLEACSGLPGRSFERFGQLAQNLGDRVAACTPGDAHGCPSVCFGLQAAAAALFAQAEKIPPAGIWGRSPRPRVALNALFAGAYEEAQAAVADGSLARFPAVKVKVGRRPLAEDRRILMLLHEHLPETTLLRLDANRSLSLDDALERFRDLPAERVEYLEEPLSNPSELAELSARTGLRMALDETLHDPAHTGLGRTQHVAAWILKPALIGHWKRVRYLAEDATKHGKAVVISSTLESGLGLWALAQVAAALPGADVPAGLATDPWLKLDIVSPPYDSSPGFVRTADWIAAPAPAILERLRFRPVA